MKARLLKAMNVPGIILIALFFMTIQSTLFSNQTIYFFQPDGVLLLVLWMATKRTFTEGGLLTLALAYCVELHSAAPQGMFLVDYMIIFLMGRFLYRHFQVLNRRTLVAVGMVSAIMSRVIILFILFLMNKGDNQWLHTLQLLAPACIVQGALIPFVFIFLHRFDLWSLKNPEAEHRYERDFFLDEEPI